MKTKLALVASLNFTDFIVIKHNVYNEIVRSEWLVSPKWANPRYVFLCLILEQLS